MILELSFQTFLTSIFNFYFIISHVYNIFLAHLLNKEHITCYDTGTIVSNICYITYQLGQHRNPLNKPSTSYDIFCYQANAHLHLEFFCNEFKEDKSIKHWVPLQAHPFCFLHFFLLGFVRQDTHFFLKAHPAFLHVFLLASLIAVQGVPILPMFLMFPSQTQLISLHSNRFAPLLHDWHVSWSSSTQLHPAFEHFFLFLLSVEHIMHSPFFQTQPIVPQFFFDVPVVQISESGSPVIVGEVDGAPVGAGTGDVDGEVDGSETGDADGEADGSETGDFDEADGSETGDVETGDGEVGGSVASAPMHGDSENLSKNEFIEV